MKEKAGWTFAEYSVDLINARLLRETVELRLTPRVFSTLCYLLEHAGTLVTKEALLDAVWQRRFVSDSVLKDCINQLRRALHDDPKSPRFIQTVVKRGYRFIADVQITVSEQTLSPPPAPLAISPVRLQGMPFVGRERPLAQLYRLFSRALAGDRQAVFVTGEAGLGKTTLIEMFLDRVGRNANGKGLTLLTGQCVEQYGAGEAFLPLLQALGNLYRGSKGGDYLEALRKIAPTWLAQIPWAIDSSLQDALQREVLGATRERMAREFCELIAVLSLTAPIILVLEDLHWTDFATLDLLSLLARRRERGMLMVISSYRPVELILRKHPLKALKQELQLHALCTELALDSFSETDIQDYLNKRIGPCLGGSALVSFVHRRTEGHPLFTVNLVDYLLTQAAITKSPEAGWMWREPTAALSIGIPENLRQMIEYHIERLTPDEQRALSIIAIAGGECSAALLARVQDLGLLEAEACCEDLAKKSHVLTRSGIVEWPDGTVAGRYVYLHALYLEFMDQWLAPAQRIDLHFRVGLCLENAYRGNTDEIAAKLAFHFEQGRDAKRALEYLQKAAESSAKGFAYREAVAYLTRALNQVERLVEPGKVTCQLDLMLQRASLKRSAGDMQDAAVDLGEAMRLARAEKDRSGEVKVLLELSRVCFWIDRAQCLIFAEEARQKAKTLDNEILEALAAANHAGFRLHLQGWNETDDTTSRYALEIVRHAGTPGALGMRLTFHSILEICRANYEAGVLAAREGKQIAVSLGDGYLHMVCEYWQLWALLHLGDWQEARQGLYEALDIADRNAMVFVQHRLRFLLAWLHAESLDFASALKHAKNANDSIPYERDMTVSCTAALTLCKIHLGLGDHHLAQQYLNDINGRFAKDSLYLESQQRMPLQHLQAETFLHLGNLSAATAAANRLCEMAEAPGEHTYYALGQHTLMKIAAKEQRWPLVVKIGDKALKASGEQAVPLAAWKIHRSLSEAHRNLDASSLADYHHEQYKAVVQKLIGFLDANDSMRQSLVAGC